MTPYVYLLSAFIFFTKLLCLPVMVWLLGPVKKFTAQSSLRRFSLSVQDFQ